MDRGNISDKSTQVNRRTEHMLEGRLLGNHLVKHRIARGGMGDIYLASHARLGGKVAIKVLKPELTMRQDIVDRFFNEARAVNQIGHPNIININDFVEDYDESPPLVYMVMEHLEGEDLGYYLRNTGTMSPPEAVHVILQVASALQAVHAQKIIHRDLKPGNIFLLDTDDPQPRIKLLDFGIARVMEREGEQPLTEPGTAIGTPEYMAPEQLMAQPVDQRTDIYALGVVLYELLCGKVPFAAKSIGEIYGMVMKDLPPPLSAETGGTTSVDPRLEAQIFRCLLKDPELRFQSAGELYRALKDYLQDVRAPREYAAGGAEAFRPTVAVGGGERLSDKVNWKLLLVLVFVMVGVVIGVAVRLIRGTDVPPPAVDRQPLPSKTRPPAAQPAATPVATPAAPDQGVAEPDAASEAAPDASPAAASPPTHRPTPRPIKKPPRKPPRKGGGKTKKVDVTHGTIDPFAD